MIPSKKFTSPCRNPLTTKSEDCTVDNKKPKTKKCAICKASFPVFRSMQKVCGPKCAQAVAELKRLKEAAKREQEERKKTRVQREALKSRQQWLKEAQVAFNRYIRTRDAAEPCISCGRFHTGAYDAGHYRSVGAQPAIRFNEDNCHKQCVPCNQHKAGNVIEYRLRLLQKIGPERLAFLEQDHPAVKYTIEDAKRIKALYRDKNKQLADKEVA
jgi:hypothetical protein